MKQIKEQYKKALGFHYGDKDKLISELKINIKRYSAAPSTPRISERVKLLKAILKEAER